MLKRDALGRIVQALPLLLGASLLTFLLIHAAPGGPFAAQALNPRAQPGAIALLEARWGLDQPVHVQYLNWLGNILRGDLGYSIRTGQPVLETVGHAIWPSVELTMVATTLAMGLALLAGLLAALRPNSLLDRAVAAGAYLTLSVPAFLWSLLLVAVFSVKLGLLPSAGFAEPGQPFSLGDHLRHLALPAITLALPLAAMWSRYARESIREALASIYVRAAKARGVPPVLLILRHVLPNALTPLATVAALELPQMFAGAVIVETIYAWPGLGRLLQTAVLGRDYPVVMGLLLLTATLVILSNLAADLFHGILDPRVRHE